MRGSDGGITLKVGRFKGRLRHPINPNIAPNFYVASYSLGANLVVTNPERGALRSQLK